MKKTDLDIIGRTVFTLLVGLMFFYLIYSMSDFRDTYSEKQTSSIEQIIDKALVQCYALEGGYPVDIAYIEKYGFIFDYDKYVYHYEWYGSNLKPVSIVIKK